MVTLGALRATNVNALRAAAIKNGRNPAIFNQLVARDPSNFKDRLPFAWQLELFRFALERLAARIQPALCKEDKAIWKALGMKFDGCHCLQGPNDEVVTGAGADLRFASDRAARSSSVASSRPLPDQKNLFPILG
jgi:hypothetical protein